MTTQDNLVKAKTSAEEVIDLRQYFRVIDKFKWRIFFLALIASLLAGIVALNMAPVYRATATLLIEAEQTKAVSFQEIYGLDSNRKEYYLTQFEILGSNKIAEEVVQRLNLKKHADFIPKESLIQKVKSAIPFIPKKASLPLTAQEQARAQLQKLVEAFKKRLTISPVKKTQLVNITFESEDPKLAALVANTVGEVYIEQHLSAKMGITKKAAGWLTTRLSDLRVQLDASESKLQAYREQENLIDVQGVVGLVTKELEQTSEQLVIARNEKNKLESIVRVISEYGRDNIDMLESIPAITSHKVIQDVKQTVVKAELKVSELAETYGPKHPVMIAARSELKTVEDNLTVQIQRLITGIDKELSTSERNIVALDKELVRIRAQYQAVTRKENDYRQLKREVQTNRQLYDTFLSRSKETEVTSDFNSAVARFTDKAFRPNEPAKPRKALIVILVFVATISLGVVIAFIIEALDDTVKSASDVEAKLSQRMLGLLPLINIGKDKDLSLHHFFEEDGRKFAESIRTLRTSFVLTQLNKDSKIIEVTSSVPNEGKTTTSTNLAFSLGQMEKTILIDADMRRPSIGKTFGIPAYHPGLANLIAGTDKFEECIFEDEKSGITVMPSGQIPPNPLELLASPRFIKLLESLKQKYDRIVIDTAPVQAVSDSLVIAQHSDAVVYVVRSDDTRAGVVQDGIGRLVQVNAKFAGVVLNQVDTKKISKSDNYYGYQGYYNEQGYGEDPKPA